MPLEKEIVRFIEIELKSLKRFYINVHGSKFSTSGTPDIMTCDANGRLMGIEVKRSGGSPTVNQLRRGIEIIQSGGRFIVAYEDFDLFKVDSNCCEKLIIHSDLFTLHTQIEKFSLGKTVEVMLK